ncbi:MAG: hypothetical protein EXS35_18865 [Pedosphaera sp.]|nr:hypothetical protein [Pedosphaera sp.]
MKLIRSLNARWLAAALTLLLAGCATRKIDWAARVGQYTFDQAIVDFGPPDKQAKLTDGTLVADWLTRRGYHEIYQPAPLYPYHRHYYGPYSSFGGGYVDSYSPDFFLRLTFDPEGRLKTWKNFAR